MMIIMMIMMTDMVLVKFFHNRHEMLSRVAVYELSGVAVVLGVLPNLHATLIHRPVLHESRGIKS